jgi:hypothetical protein
MLRRHIACQAARPIRNECRDHATQRPYVRLSPLAYVTGSRSHGSIGSPPERGAGAYTAWSGHVSVPDPRLTLIKAWVSFAPEPWDLAASSPDPAQRGGGGPGARPRGPGTLVAILDLTRWSGPYTQGSDTFPWGSRPTVDILGYIVFPSTTWRSWGRPRGGPGADHVEGSGAVYDATRYSRVGTVPSHCSKGYP